MANNELTNKYKKKISDKLTKQFGYKSLMQIPTLDKIVINACAGDATQDSKLLDLLFNEIMLITGQKPIKTKSKKAIATFKLREGQEIGLKVTLRRENM
jgi:large subunit ribosomal protein L5